MSTPSATPRILLDLLATLLAPLFLDAAGHNLNLARAAALETIAEYRIASGADLLLAAQVIAFSLTSIATLMQSLTEDLTEQAASRVQRTANTLSRTADRCRKALEKTHREPPPPPPPQPAFSLPDPDEVLAEFLQRVGRAPVAAPARPNTAPGAAQRQTQPHAPAPAASPARPQPASPQPASPDRNQAGVSPPMRPATPTSSGLTRP